MPHLDQLPHADSIDKPHEESRKDLKGIKEAQTFFSSFGLAIEDDGFVTKEPSEEQIVKLAAWSEGTKEDGMDMPTETAFYQKTLLAVSLWRQREGSKTNYLIGKGTGVEVSLRGNVQGRIKRPVEFSYRCHSDFELYGVDYEAGANGSNLLNKPIYTNAFKEVFGNQEYFPPTKTKGLKNIPPTLLHETAETVDLGGVQILIPQLELLFLDKFLSRESTPRPEGYDHELLAKQYVLDRALLHQYLDQLSIAPGIIEIQAIRKKEYAGHLAGIKRRFSKLKEEIHLTGKEPSIQDLVTELNNLIGIQIQTHGTERKFSVSGIRVHLWKALDAEQVDTDGNIIDKAFLEKLQNGIDKEHEDSSENDRKKHVELDELLDKIEREFDIKNLIAQTLAVL